jgi:hypothetical protein
MKLKSMSDEELQTARHDAQMALATAFIQTASVPELLELVAAIEVAKAAATVTTRETEALQALGVDHGKV